ncbi:MAG: YXWGXW repeat-containing protein [Akkermansiaceae bacterium]|nr:YXWGXW repeat-containing protein [Verrucomicrobiales bacterium]
MVPAVAKSQFTVVSRPPLPQIELVGKPPGPDYVWMPGHWERKEHWTWISGHWAQTPRPQAAWIPGRWARCDQGWMWVAGYWR